MTIQITKRVEISYGHRLKKHEAGCRYYHGHNGMVSATVASHVHTNGMVMDYSDLKEHLLDVLAKWDHAMIVEEDDPLVVAVSTLDSEHPLVLASRLVVVSGPPTAENLALWTANSLRLKLPQGIRLVELRFEETSSCFAVYRD
jgi:6-pyruvoyltetrahydropterin/6-carboxytetrahydropterin synthase